MADVFIERHPQADGLRSKLVTGNTVILGAVIAALYLLTLFLTPRLDPREPPLLKPRIPLIGHIIGILRHQTDYHRILHEEKPMPIASLQMLWGRIYAVWDPQLAQAALRARGLSFEPFIVEFAKKTFDLTEETFSKITSNPKLIPEFTEAIHGSMSAVHLHRMNVNALSYISRTLDSIGDGEEGRMHVPNLYLWLRELITLATTRALYGKDSNPFEKDTNLIGDLWNFEISIPALLTRPFPRLTTRNGYNARGNVQAGLSEYYSAEHDINDPTAARITLDRANVLRKYGFTNREIGLMESMLAIVGITNTVPTMYWMICNVFADPGLVTRLREEVTPLIQKGSPEKGGMSTAAIVDISKLEVQCPLLVSCYRETIRLSNVSVSMRRILQDITISDGNSNSYLLKKGVDVQIPAGISHKLGGVWGGDVMKFDPDRFLAGPGNSTGKGESNEKAKKNAYFPFGGGRHLCPGRYFAFAEILAVTCALVVGFELSPVGTGFDGIKPLPGTLASAVIRPANDGKGLGLKITRRNGWEKTEWRFEA